MTDNNNKEQQTPQEQPASQPEQQATPQPEQINYKELYVRLAADLQNFKRRVEKERTDWTETAQGIIVSAFLPIIEDFDRAINNASNHVEQGCKCPKAEYLEGLMLIQKNMKKTLEDLGVNEIETTGQFNPEYHEALAQIESPEIKSGFIAQVFSKGYMFKGKVLKHARVSVAK